MRRSSGRWRMWLVAVVALTSAACSTLGREGELMNERFAPCPASPNCVSSYADDELHGIDPLPLPPEEPMSVLEEVIRSFPRTEIVVVDGDYLHATFTSRIFRFVDDVELRIDREAGVVHVRSASRVGQGDLGVNRARVEEIRSRLQDRL